MAYPKLASVDRADFDPPAKRAAPNSTALNPMANIRIKPPRAKAFGQLTRDESAKGRCFSWLQILP